MLVSGKSANVTPTARASILVATAKRNIVFTSILLSVSSSSLDKDSFIMFAPIMASKANAIQWSIEVIYFLNWFPRKYPIAGISA